MPFAIIATCKEIRGESGTAIVSDGERRVLITGEWGDTTSVLWLDRTLPRETRQFATREEAEKHGHYLDSDEAKNDRSWWKTWHPWYVEPKSWEVVELKAVTRTETIGWAVANGVKDCGEAGHAEGRCGNAQCLSGNAGVPGELARSIADEGPVGSYGVETPREVKP
jgi:hypothetical protein